MFADLVSNFRFYYNQVTSLVKDYKSIFVTKCYMHFWQKIAAAWWGGRVEYGTFRASSAVSSPDA
jgi:hypothetical protein